MHGKVSFIELGTSDTERSRPFFQRVFGWAFTARIRRRFMFSSRSPIWSKRSHWFGRPAAKRIRPGRRNLDSVAWPFAAIRKAYASAFISKPVIEAPSVSRY
jgi:hypothetical protein